MLLNRSLTTMMSWQCAGVLCTKVMPCHHKKYIRAVITVSPSSALFNHNQSAYCIQHPHGLHEGNRRDSNPELDARLPEPALHCGRLKEPLPPPDSSIPEEDEAGQGRT